jgi:hypothetical protein
MRLVLNDEDGICANIAHPNDFSLFRIYCTVGSIPIKCAKSSTCGGHLIGNLPGNLAGTVIDNAQCEGPGIGQGARIKSNRLRIY